MKFEKGQLLQLTRRFFLTLAAIRLKQKEQALVAGFFSAYHPMDPFGALQLEKELRKVKPDELREKAMDLTNPFIELGKKRGLQEGLQKGIARGRQQGDAYSGGMHSLE